MKIAAAAAIAALLFLCYMFWEAHRNRLRRLNLEYADFPAEHGTLTILFISDIHRRSISDKLLRGLPQKPDVICIGGDLTEKGVPLERTRDNLKKLGKIGQVVMVYGNNDPEAGLPNLERILAEEKTVLLRNESYEVPSASGKRIHIAGIDEMKFGWDRLEACLKQPADFRIVLCHNPDIHRQLNEQSDVRLVLSGHTHGGQIRLFGFGLYEKGKLHRRAFGDQLISNGYGTTQLPLRLNAPAEAHFITITGKKNH
ncbi:metallophosphoesterase [Metabacillus mangrovi]|nr:metallophosphoesterase [Metabacillus mangrovi]